MISKGAGMSGRGGLGLCGWSVDRDDARRGIEVAAELGLRHVQVGFFSCESLQRVDAAALTRVAAQSGVTLVGLFVGFEDEDYSSIQRIRETGGFVNAEMFEPRWAVLQKAADVAAAIGCRSVAIHAGVIPDDPAAGSRRALRERILRVAATLKARGLRLLLETGAEPAATLLDFVDALEVDNVGIGFDPANLVIYGTGDPVDAVKRLRGRIEVVHLKDARRSASPGTAFGERAPFGAGDVQIPRLVSKLRASAYDGPMLLDVDARREGGAALREAVSFMDSLVGGPGERWGVGPP